VNSTNFVNIINVLIVKRIINIKLLYKQLIVLIIVSAVFAACKDDGSSDDQANDSDKEFSSQQYNRPDSELKYLDTPGDRLYDRLYFIGWSKDGKAAYITEPADEATGYYFFNFIILDSKTDKQLFEWKIDVDDASYEGSLKQTWQNNHKLFTEELNKYKIYPGKGDMKKFPLTIESQNYSIAQNVEYEKHEYFPFDVVSRAEFFLQNENQKQSIFKKNYDADLKLNVKASGCILSPYSNDALLLIAQEQRGYEGPPHLIRLKVSGFEFPEN